MIMEALICLALNVYHEARGEPEEGRVGVAWVVVNRAADPGFPPTVCEVVIQGGERLHRCQFSWWCDGRSDQPRDTEAWKAALVTAGMMVLGTVPDPTGGALYYHTLNVRPAWRLRFKVTGTIGQHIFYRRTVQ